MLASQKLKGCQWPGGGWQEGFRLPEARTCALVPTEIRTGLCRRGGLSPAAPHTQMWADVGMLRVETTRLFLFDGVGLINGGGDNANSTSQVDCWQESWCLNTFCKNFMEVFENRVSPHVSGGLVGGLPIRLGVDSTNPQSLFNILILWSRLDRHMWPQRKENGDLMESFMFCIFSSCLFPNGR